VQAQLVFPVVWDLTCRGCGSGAGARAWPLRDSGKKETEAVQEHMHEQLITRVSSGVAKGEEYSDNK